MSSLNVLVVDDEEALRETLGMFLERHGYTISTAEGGNPAFEKVKAGKFDVIVSDIRMPNGSGVDLLQKLKELENPPPIIFVTGFSDEDESELISKGAVAIFDKPVDRKALISKIEEFTKQ